METRSTTAVSRHSILLDYRRLWKATQTVEGLHWWERLLNTKRCVSAHWCLSEAWRKLCQQYYLNGMSEQEARTIGYDLDRAQRLLERYYGDQR